MALASLDWPCCSPAQTQCSVAPFNRRRTVVLASRLGVSISCCAELRLQEPLDSARRPFVPSDDDEENGRDEDGNGEGNKDHGSNGSSFGHSASSLICASMSAPDSGPTLQIDERERIRRQRIGFANKGKTPWNKGKHHSPETIARMRERNKIVMQDPKIRERLRQHSHPQTQETRKKIRQFMKARMQFERRQLTIVQEWKDSVAELARVGNSGDDELQWDSYVVLKGELRRLYFAAKKLKETVPRACTLQQRLKISEAVRAKWADPEYRNRVLDGSLQARQKSQGERILKEKCSDPEFDDILSILTRVPVGYPGDYAWRPPAAKVGSFNDPRSNEKLKKIKMLRVRKVAQKETGLDAEVAGDESLEAKAIQLGVIGGALQSGTASESDQLAALQRAQREAAERARILLAEAERAAILAAQALDAAGAHDESLRDSLLEAWSMLDEANKSIRDIELGSTHAK